MISRRGSPLIAATVAMTAAMTAGACQPPGAPNTTRPAPPARAFELTDLLGTWRWLHRATEDGTTRVEDELWRLHPGDTPTRLSGAYTRSVEVRAEDRVPFTCNQRPWYRQRARFEVTVELASSGFTITEGEYRAEPSPCDHGFRHVVTYHADFDRDRLRLSWDGGVQTLTHLDRELAAATEPPWPEHHTPYGTWRWDASSYDAEGNVRDESEWWEIVRHGDAGIDATYRRRVTVRSADGAPIACANAPSWSFDDSYVLDGRREDEHWHFYERAADPGDHPCLRITPRRALDEATAEQLGDHLILEWRGKRRQVLYRLE